MSDPANAADRLYRPEELEVPLQPAEPADTAQEDDQPSRTVRVPVRRGAGPFGRLEYLEVDAETAAQWDSRMWHDEPPQ